MGKKKWIKPQDRKWELSKAQKEFERLLAENDYTIEAVREYVSCMDYLIYKDGVSNEYRFHYVDNKVSTGRLNFKNWERYYEVAFTHYKVTTQEEAGIKIGDIKGYPSSNGGDAVLFKVRVIDIDKCDGVIYCDIEPVDFDSFTRSVEASKLLDWED